MAHLEGERKEEVLTTSHRLWNNFIFRGKPGPITEQDFIDMTNQDYKTDKAKFVENIRKDCVDDVSCFDFKKQGFITEEDFLMGCKAAGMENEQWNKTFFNTFKPVDGKIGVDVMVDAWVKFLTEEDSSKEDLVMETLQSADNA